MDLEALVGQYGRALAKTVPPGAALEVKPGGQLEALLEALGSELAKLDQRTERFLEEDDPRLAAELLPEWERLLGLPSACTGALVSTAARRAAVVTRLRAAGGANPALIVAALEAYGFEGVEVVEYQAANVDNTDCEGPIYSSEWAFVWDLLAPEINPIFFRVGLSTVGEPLAENGNGTLTCLAAELAPAHTYPRAVFALPASASYQPWDPANFVAPTLELTLEPTPPAVT